MDQIMDEKDRIIAERMEICRVMFNRCWAIMGGSGMCMMCGLREKCDKERGEKRGENR